MNVAVLTSRYHQRADEGDGCDGIGRGHQRCMQQRRNARDQVIAEEPGQHENIQPDFQFTGHGLASFPPASAAFAPSCMIWPWCVTSEPRITSSDKSICTCPFF